MNVSKESTVYALGELVTADGTRREFEYDLGSFTGKPDKSSLPELTSAIWQ